MSDERQEQPAASAQVDLVSHTGNFIARGLYNGQSKIRVRLYSWDQGTALDRDFFRDRLAAALRLRTSLGLDGLGRARRRDLFAGLLAELARPEGIYLRTERGVGRLEGLELHDGPLWGTPP